MRYKYKDVLITQNDPTVAHRPVPCTLKLFNERLHGIPTTGCLRTLRTLSWHKAPSLSRNSNTLASRAPRQQGCGLWDLAIGQAPVDMLGETIAHTWPDDFAILAVAAGNKLREKLPQKHHSNCNSC